MRRIKMYQTVLESLSTDASGYILRDFSVPNPQDLLNIEPVGMFLRGHSVDHALDLERVKKNRDDAMAVANNLLFQLAASRSYWWKYRIEATCLFADAVETFSNLKRLFDGVGSDSLWCTKSDGHCLHFLQSFSFDAHKINPQGLFTSGLVCRKRILARKVFEGFSTYSLTRYTVQ
jgi:hypothetical protein